jgi:hypothetical protein
MSIRLILTDNCLRLALLSAPKFSHEKKAIAKFLCHEYVEAVSKTYKDYKWGRTRGKY